MSFRARLAGIAFAAFALCAAAPAPEQVPVEGLYVAHIMETASALEIQPGGRFRWMFSMGALDLEAEGLWTRREDGSLVLNSDPPVIAPSFELTGTSRDGRGGLLVRVADEKGRAPVFLDIAAEYADGTNELANLENGQHRFEQKRKRPIIAIRVVSEPFDLVSERFTVSPKSANVIDIRFHPNQMGRADFRDVPVRVEPGALVMTWRGTEMRYTPEQWPTGSDDSEGPGCIDTD